MRSFGKQLLESVAFLHDLQLIHTDLKPENILLASLEYSKHSDLPGTRYAAVAVASFPMYPLQEMMTSVQSSHHVLCSIRHQLAPSTPRFTNPRAHM